MLDEGPWLEALTRRLAECPAEFLEEPQIGKTGKVNVAAVVSDLLRSLGGHPLDSRTLKVFQLSRAVPPERNRLRVVLIAAWLLYDPWFRERGGFAGPAAALLVSGTRDLAALVRAPSLVSDGDRREELARLCLSHLGLRPAGETEAQAEDRLMTLSTAARQQAIQASRDAEARAREIREAMAKKAAEEAADKWTRE